MLLRGEMRQDINARLVTGFERVNLRGASSSDKSRTITLLEMVE